MSVKADNNRQSAIGEWIVGSVAYTHCLVSGYFYVCVCVRVLSNIVFVGLDASFCFRGKWGEWKVKRKTLEDSFGLWARYGLYLYGHAVPACASVWVWVSLCFCLCDPFAIYGTILWMPYTHTHTHVAKETLI